MGRGPDYLVPQDGSPKLQPRAVGDESIEKNCLPGVKPSEVRGRLAFLEVRGYDGWYGYDE